MTVRTLSALALVAGLCAAHPLRAKEPERAKNTQSSAPVAQANQQLADAVAARIRAAGVAVGADIRISTQKGLVQLTGRAQTPTQRDDIVRVALSVPGVTTVQHSLEFASGVEPAQAVTPAEPGPLPVPTAPAPGTAPGYPVAPMPGYAGAPMPGYVPGMPVGPVPAPGATATTDPVPLAPPTTPAYDPHGPQMPPYSWPTYAPYNNFSRVAYPQAYPYNAWPYIGPFYPFPKVPLGWRSVQLTWEDGHWYYGRVATPHDYWRVRTW